jgi:hypothetical protein
LNWMMDYLELVDQDRPVNTVFTNRDGSILWNRKKKRPLLPDSLTVRQAKKILHDKHKWGRLCLINRPPVKPGKFALTLEQMESVINNTDEDRLRNVEKNPHFAHDQNGKPVLEVDSPGWKVITNTDQIFRPWIKRQGKSSLSTYKSVTKSRKSDL